MSTLGKRKQREDDQASHGSTLFVSNLPYTATSVDIQTLFSDIAPVRSAFVVLKQGGVSKGVGYVSFASREDAQAAFIKITTEGISLLGRSLRVQWAEKKPKDKEEAAKKNPKHSSVPLSHPRSPSDPLAIRTIVLSGLPGSIDSKSLWKKIRKYEGAEKVEWPISTDSGEDPSTAHVLFKNPATAQNAVDKLHAHIFKGSFLSATLKKRLDSLVKPPVVRPSEQSSDFGVQTRQATTAAQDSKVPAPSHASRLIIRNIPFNASERDLRAVFLPYGPIYSIHIPSTPSTRGPGEREKSSEERTDRKIPAGFAFVWMLSKKDAERAIEKCNGMVLRAGMADGMVSDKQKRKKQLREEKRKKGSEEDQGAGTKLNGGEISEDKLATERAIAVDWALSKDKWEEEKAKMLKNDEDSEMEAGSSADQGDSTDEDASSSVDATTDRSGNQSDPEDSDTEEKSTRPQLPPPEAGTTLFVRNVPFMATEDELRTLFRAFGPLRYARMTVDPSTGRSRGTGFVCFWNKEDADKPVQQSELLHQDIVKKNPFSFPSILTPDPSSASAQGLVLHGRTLDVVRAVTRDEASKLKEAGEKKREKTDKRNMYLLREGAIASNTPATETLSPAEIEKRTRSYNARKQLLKSNPSLYISKVRLSVRQIPLFVTERLLKRLANHAVREFEDDVKNGARVGLTQDELAEVADESGHEEGTKERNIERNKKGLRKVAGRRVGVKQAKIVRQQERVDPITGKGRSKGYGFLEMHQHADALRVLRWANNNPNLGPLFEEWRRDELKDLIELEKAKETKEETRLKRMRDELASGAKKNAATLIVEFSIENVQVVHRRNAIQHERKPSISARPSRPQSPPKSEVLEERSPKKRRISEDKSPVPSDKPGAHIRSLIGRKRKERKTKERRRI